MLKKSWRPKKSILIVAALAFGIMIGMLFLTSKLSDAYSTATRTVLDAPTIAQEYGVPQYAILIGESFKLSPEWSCANLLFFVKGTAEHGIVEITLRRKKLYRDSWRVIGITKGYYTRSEVSCGPAE